MSEILISPVPTLSEGMARFSYQRKFSVKSLFNAQETTGAFATLTFPSFVAFFHFLTAKLHTPDISREYVCIIPTVEELEQYLLLLKSTKLSETIMVTLQPQSSEVLETFLYVLDEQFQGLGLSLTHAEVVELTARMKEDLTLPIHQFFLREGNGNWGCIRSKWEPSSYAQEYENILKAIIANPFFRFLDLQIDYEAFESQPIKELHQLYFYFMNMQVWSAQVIPASKNPFNIPKQGILPIASTQPSESKVGVALKHRNGCLRATVSEDLTLSLDDKKTWDFPLGRYVGEDGESVPMEELNRLRALLDLKFSLPLNSNMCFVDVAANIRIMKDPYMLPYLTELVLHWLESTRSQ